MKSKARSVERTCLLDGTNCGKGSSRTCIGPVGVGGTFLPDNLRVPPPFAIFKGWRYLQLIPAIADCGKHRRSCAFRTVRIDCWLRLTEFWPAARRHHSCSSA